MEEKTCALCQIKLPEFDRDGKHNFVPEAFDENADDKDKDPHWIIKNVCINCKNSRRNPVSFGGTRREYEASELRFILNGEEIVLTV